jgi:hypothetical protein
MKLVYRRVETLPPLAWCAAVRRGENRVEVLHGPWVEANDAFFCEGAWSGEFSAGDFDASVLVGTAGKPSEGAILFATPNNTLDRIYLLELESVVLVSNSLPFLLAQAGDDVDTRCLSYSSKVASIILGLKRCARYLPTLGGRRVRLFYHSNIIVTPDLRVMEKPKASTKEFHDFADYRSFLQEKVAAIVANAGDAGRQVRYRPIATVSSGYDSPAVAVLASKAGCTEALTFQDSRPVPGHPDGLADSGEEIAARLGMEVTSFERQSYLEDPDYTEAENEGFALAFAALTPKLPGRLLLTGYHGAVWSRASMVVGPDMESADYSGGSLTEFRLRVGFLHLAVPFLGCTSLPSIYRISTSPEMRPWSLMTAYDKPIPRRLVEEAGVPRELFGTTKKAVEAVARIEGVRAVMKEDSFEDFQRFCEANWSPWLSFKDKVMCLLQSLYRRNRRMNNRVFLTARRRLGKELRLPSVVPAPLRLVTYDIRGRERLLFHWAVRKLLPRYHPSRVKCALIASQLRDVPSADGTPLLLNT